MQQEIITELSHYLNNNNIENANKRLLDLCWYYLKGSSEYNDALEIRKNYNLSKTLGQKELKETELESFKNELQQLLHKVSTIKISQEETLRNKLVAIESLEKTFNHVSKKFKFGPLSIKINKGEIVGVVGENGNGKTTFLRLLQEEISKDKGTLTHYYNLENIAATDSYKRKNRTAFIPQRITKWRGTLMENLVFLLQFMGLKA